MKKINENTLKTLAIDIVNQIEEELVGGLVGGNNVGGAIASIGMNTGPAPTTSGNVGSAPTATNTKDTKKSAGKNNTNTGQETYAVIGTTTNPLGLVGTGEKGTSTVSVGVKSSKATKTNSGSVQSIIKAVGK